jgi:hypothetical protein
MGVGRDVGLHYTGSIVITIEFDGRHHASVKKVTDTKTEVSEWWLTSIVSLTDRNQRAWPRTMTAIEIRPHRWGLESDSVRNHEPRSDFSTNVRACPVRTLYFSAIGAAAFSQLLSSPDRS